MNVSVMEQSGCHGHSVRFRYPTISAIIEREKSPNYMIYLHIRTKKCDISESILVPERLWILNPMYHLFFVLGHNRYVQTPNNDQYNKPSEYMRFTLTSSVCN